MSFCLDFSIGERRTKLRHNGSPAELLEAAGRMLNLEYGKIYMEASPEDAELFKRLCMMAFSDGESPIWKPDGYASLMEEEAALRFPGE